tara:strand:+ start:19 stop:195 length:177 start_codon:yes stop_codon:yes gene_type:complete
MMESDHLNNEELKLEILRIVKENGTEFQKNDPLPICENYYKWIKSKTILKKNLADKKE